MLLTDILLVGCCLITSRLFLTVWLRYQDRRWWCKCGKRNLWDGNIHSSHCSQHFLDPFAFTHILHGIGFYFLTWLFLSHWIPSALYRCVISNLVEVTWEAVENSDVIINKYRKDTAQQGYIGDSVANSIGDTLSCDIGYILAHILGPRASFLYFVITEVVLLVWIMDNLTLNCLMIIYPIESVKKWQQAGAPQKKSKK